MPFIGTAESGPENNDTFAFYAESNSPPVQHEKNGKINRIVPSVENKCIITRRGRALSGFDVPTTPIVNNTLKLKSLLTTKTYYP